MLACINKQAHAHDFGLGGVCCLLECGYFHIPKSYGYTTM